MSLHALRRLAPCALAGWVLAGAGAGEPPRLPAQRAVVGELAPGETREWALDLAARDFVRLWAAPAWGFAGEPPDLTLAVHAPGGAAVAQADSGAGGEARLTFAAPDAGTFRVTVRWADGGSGGWLRLGIGERRPGRAGDGLRVEVDAALLRAAETALSPPREDEARRLVEAAVERARAAGLADLEAAALAVRADLEPAAAAESWLDQALAAAVRGGDPAVAAAVHQRRGDLARRNADAAAAFRASAESWREAGREREQGIALLRLARIELRQERHAEAAAAATSARSIHLRWGDLDGAAQALANEARARGELGEAEAAYDRALAAVEVARRFGSADAAGACLNRLAGIERERGDFEAALDSYREALAAARASAERALRAGGQAESRVPVLSIRNNVAAVLLDLRRPDLARDETRGALAELAAEAPRDDGELSAQETLVRTEGVALEDLGDTPAALERFAEALRINDRREPRRAADGRARTLQWQGLALARGGREEEGVAALRQALALRQLGSDPVGVALTRFALGSALARAGRSGEARTELELVVDADGSRLSRFARARALVVLAGLDRDAGRPEPAVRRAEEALAGFEELRGRLSSEERRTAFFTGSREGFEVLLDALLAQAEAPGGEGFAEQAFAASERARARGLLDLLAEADFEGGRARREAVRLERRARALGGMREEAGRENPDLVAGFADGPEALRREAEARQAALPAGGAPAVAAAQPLALAGARALLADGEALLEYFVGSRASYLFVVTGDRLSWHRLPAREALARPIEDYRAAMGSWQGRAPRVYLETARRLYRELVPPAAAARLAASPRWIVSPDGPLHLLSFEALLTADPGSPRVDWAALPYLLRERSIRYVPSASVLADLQRDGLARWAEPEAAAGERRFVAFAPFAEAAGTPPAAAGGVARSRDGSWPPLPATRDEVERIARGFGAAADVFLGAAASEARFKAFPFERGAWWVHLATHGDVDDDRPERSGLLLAPGDGGEDGRLTAAEILGLRGFLPRLVVLSACRTGSGKMVTGEGIVGLTRAFLHSGTPAVVVSLWNVEDQATAELMVALQRALGGRADLAEAFRLARLRLIEDGRWAEPFRWAPFVLVGG